MKSGLFSALLLAAVLGLPAAAAPAAPAAVLGKADSAAVIALKRVAERYALNKTRISALLDLKLKPEPLPANLPNPFYRSPDLPAPDGTRPGGLGVPGGPGGETPGTTEAPPEPDVSDAGTLAKFVATLKVSGLTVIKGVSFLTLNGTPCKTGDIIPVEVKGHSIFIQVKAITPDELTLRLNEEEQVIRLRR